MKGFTLIELMIVLAVVAILVALAIPQFQQYKKRAAGEQINTNTGSGEITSSSSSCK